MSICASVLDRIPWQLANQNDYRQRDVSWGIKKGTRMPTEPMIRKSTHDLALLVANNFAAAGLPEEIERFFLQNKGEVIPAIQRGFVLPGASEKKIEVVDEAKPLILTGTGNTFADWLSAREKMHEFLTGEKVVLRNMFVVDDKTLARTDIMPFFRPARATNRMALDWKMKLGMNPSYEEVDVMTYRNSEGPKEPQLGFIKRSGRPDKNTLGDNAKSADDLLEIKIDANQAWIGLYGWSDTDNLHTLITQEHLDSVDTLTRFPDDRLPGDGKVALGHWLVVSAQASFYWSSRVSCSPNIGARLAEFFPLRKPRFFFP